MVCCAVFNCNSNNDKRLKRNANPYNEHIRYFRFPQDVYYSKIWIEKCCRSDKFNIKTSFICSKHFTKDNYKRNLQHELLGYSPKNSKKLNTDAIPTENLPSKGLNQSSLKREEHQNIQQSKPTVILEPFQIKIEDPIEIEDIAKIEASENNSEEILDEHPKIPEGFVIKTEGPFEANDIIRGEAFEVKTEDSIEIEDIVKIDEALENNAEEILDKHPKIEAAFIIKTEDPFEDPLIIEDPLKTEDPINPVAITSEYEAKLTAEDESEEHVLPDSKDDNNQNFKAENEYTNIDKMKSECKETVELSQPPKMVTTTPSTAPPSLQSPPLNVFSNNFANSWILIPNTVKPSLGMPASMEPFSSTKNNVLNECQFIRNVTQRTSACSPQTTCSNTIHTKSLRKVKTSTASTQPKSTATSLKKLPKITKKFAMQAESVSTADAALNAIIDKGKIKKLRSNCMAQTAKIELLSQELRCKIKKIKELEATLSALKTQRQREHYERTLKEKVDFATLNKGPPPF